MSPVPPLAKHLTAVEREWFQAVLAERSEDQLGPPPPGIREQTDGATGFDG
jgi:hypothetical protein